MRQAITKDQAHASRMEHRFKGVGMGYDRPGLPAMPTNTIFPPSKCEPPAVAAEGSFHFLSPPTERGAPAQVMRWHSKDREWTPLREGAGNRVGFSSKYLAAHGWFYLGPMGSG